MAAITAADRTYIRRMVGDTADLPLWTDADLDAIWEDAEAGQNRNRVIVNCLRELLANAAKFNDYTIGQTSEKKQQVFQNLQMMVEHWEKVTQSSATYRMVGLAAVPERNKDTPNGY